MFVLALDIGMKKTGVAFGDTSSGFIVALDTLKQNTIDDLATHVVHVIAEKKIGRLIVGLPLLLSGKEGEQSNIVRNAVENIKIKTPIEIEFVDERYTTTGQKSALRADPDATAACNILTIWMDKKKAIDI